MKVKATTYTFTKGSAGAGTILFTGTVIPTTLDQILLVVDTTAGVIIYSPFDVTKLGTFSGATLTLSADTSALNNADKLLIFVENGFNYNTVEGMDVDNAVQTSSMKPVAIGGRAVDASTYSPAYTGGDAAQIAIDKDTGRILTGIGGISLANYGDNLGAYIALSTDNSLGGSPIKITALVETATAVKVGAGNLTELFANNNTVGALYLKGYFKTSVTVASDVPDFVIPLPIGFMGSVLGSSPMGFPIGLMLRVCTGIGNTDNTAPASGIPIWGKYK